MSETDGVTVTLRAAGRTHAGQVRGGNEDAFLSLEGLYAVADGMGGHQAGEVAAALAISTLQSGADGGIPSEDRLVELVEDANAAIRDASRHDRNQAGMGTTLTALARVDAQLVLVNVGDSRTYLVREGRMRRMTVDHSYVQELVTSGQITEEEARLHPRRNIVTRALGIDDAVDVDRWVQPAVRGDRWLLCSDGLVDEVPDHEIADVLVGVADPGAAADQLVAMALRHGGRDNVTVLVVDVVDGVEPPDDTAELLREPHWAEELEEPPEWGEGEDPPEAGDPDPTATAAAVATDPAPTTPIAMLPPPDTPPQDVTFRDATPASIRRPRKGPSWGAILFWFVIGAVLVGAFVVVAAYARTGWFVGVHDDQIVVYQGRPGGVLWFDPTVAATSQLAADDLPDDLLDEVRDNPTFGSKAAAARYINGLRDEVEQAGDQPADDERSTTSTTVPRTGTTTRTTTGAPTTSTAP